MADRLLIAETPRAGRSNHRFICSPGAGISDVDASRLVADALALAGDRPWVAGSDYVAVIRRGLFQANSDRLGNEVLVLKGVGTDIAPPAALESLAARLTFHLGTLGEVAADVADRPGLVVEHARFGVWLHGLGDLGGAARPASGVSARTVVLVAVVVGLLAGGGIAFYATRPKVDPAPPDGGTVAAASGGDSPTPQPTDGKIDPFAGLQNSPALIALLGPGTRLTKEEMGELRAYLGEWRNHLKAFRDAANKAGLTPDGGWLGKEPPALADVPALALFAEFTRPRAAAWADLERVDASGPGLPASHAAAAAILHDVFFTSPAGRAFLGEPPSFRAALRALRDPGLNQPGGPKSLAVVLKQEARRLSVPVADRLVPVQTAALNFQSANNPPTGGGRPPLDFPAIPTH